MRNVTNKELYFELLKPQIKQPTAIETWVDLFPFLEHVSWRNIFKNTHQIVPDTYLQTFQCKIMHRLTNCNYNIYKWKLKEQPYCKYCKHIDTMEHHFYLRAFCNLFWEQVGNHIAVTFGLTESFNLIICEVMFGLEYVHNPIPLNRVINMIVVIGKWCINNCQILKSRYVYQCCWEKNPN